VLEIGEFIYPWGNGHYTRMMALDQVLPKYIKSEFEVHYSSKGEIYQKLLEKFPTKKQHIHEIFMPTPIDGKKGPSVTRSLWNFLLPVSGNPPLVKQISSYLIKEAKLYDEQKFDLVINDGDVGSNVLAEKRGINCIFVTNQFKPKLWKSHSYFYPSLVYISKQIEKATKIVVADSAPPNTICEYNLNFTDKIKEKVVYAGHFSNKIITYPKPKSDLEKLIGNEDFGYWMQTGNKATNDVTGKKYRQVFHTNEMRNEKRIVSHAKNDPTIDRVTGKDGKVYSFSEAFDKKMDWIQIDVGFLSEQEKNAVLDLCKYAVINGSHTAMGEILGIKAKPIIGIPIYDEHTNQLKWAEDRHLGVLATNKKQVIMGVHKIRKNYEVYLENVTEFARSFDRNGAQNTAEIISEMLES
jgi:UDP-N-acetylglucosamine--N-acetylmuramyl-(pentapeptide) pyrophosphoryl-undecaprenol N-acetylglucosamine transferase